MAADAAGNDNKAVFVPVGGFLAFAPAGTEIPSKVEGAVSGLTLPPTFKRVGLIKVDGGFEWTGEASGDALEYWQEGYSEPSGLVDANLVVGLAQFDEIVRELIYGVAPDANGAIDVVLAGNSNKYVIWTDEVDKFRRIRRRIAPNTGVSAVKEDKSERGSVQAQSTTFKVDKAQEIGGAHYREWLIDPPTETP